MDNSVNVQFNNNYFFGKFLMPEIQFPAYNYGINYGVNYGLNFEANYGANFGVFLPQNLPYFNPQNLFVFNPFPFFPTQQISLNSNKTNIFENAKKIIEKPKLTPPKTYYSESLNNNRLKTNIQKTTNLKIDNSYIYLSKSEAEKKAANDPRLEKLTGGKNWSVAMESFITDIPYATKGTGAILEKVASMIGEKLVITSALGTGERKNPHKKSGTDSHHNALNPKLDIRICGNGKDLERKLNSTGYFSLVSREKDHLDVQIDISKLSNFESMG